MKMKYIARKVILPWQGLIVLGILTATVCGGEKLVATVNHNGTVTAKAAACTVQSFDGGGSSVMKMNLHCNARGYAATTDDKIMVAYLNKHKPLVCTLYKGDYAECKVAT